MDNNLYNDDYDSLENELGEIVTEGVIDIDINKELEDSINELNQLKTQYSELDTSKLLTLCKENVLDTIKSQFPLLFLNPSKNKDCLNDENNDFDISPDYVENAHKQLKHVADVDDIENKVSKKHGSKTPEEKSKIAIKNVSISDKEYEKKYKKSKLKNPQVKTMIKDGGKEVAIAALRPILLDLSNQIMIEVNVTLEKKGQESFKEILHRFREKLGIILENIKNTWKDILKESFAEGIMELLSNIVVFVINIFFTTLRKFIAMIRAGFVSFCEAIKLLSNPPANMTKEEINYQALKIITAGIIGAASIGLSAAIERGLQAIPGLQPLMLFPIPSLGSEPRTVSDILAVTLSSLAGGLMTTIVLYLMDKCRNQAIKTNLEIRMIARSGVIVNCQIAKTWFELSKAYDFVETKTEKTKEQFNKMDEFLDYNNKIMNEADARRDEAMNLLRKQLKR